MRIFNNKLKKLILRAGIALLPAISHATSINQGLPGIADKVQPIVDTMCGPMAFLLSVAGLLTAAGIWKFAGHSAGMKFISGVFAGLIIIANIVAWIGYFAGASI